MKLFRFAFIFGLYFLIAPWVMSADDSRRIRKLELDKMDKIPSAGTILNIGTVTASYVLATTATIPTLNVTTITASHVETTTVDATRIAVSSISLTNLSSIFGYKIGTFTGDAGGGQSITGVGFKPRMVILFHGRGGSTFFRLSFGVMTANGEQWAYGADSTDTDSGGDTFINTSRCIEVYGNSGTVASDAHFTSMDTDGFTITWDNPNSTYVYGYIAFQ